MSYILVDHTKAGGAKTKADENAQGSRPYWVHVKAQQILGWQSKMVNNREQLTRVRILEQVNESDQGTDDNWNDDDVKAQVRVLYPDKYELHRKDSEGKWSVFETGENTLGEISLVAVYANKTGFMQGAPPLEDLANINRAHWASTSEQNNILHVVRVPFLFGKGFEQGDFEPESGGGVAFALDTSRVLITTKTEATLEWIEHQGRAIEVGRQSLSDLTEQMAIIGTQKLVKNPGNITATAEAIGTAESSSDLGVMVRNAEHAFNQAILLMGKWATIKNTGRIDICPDWLIIELDSQDLAAILDLRRNGDLSYESVISCLMTRKLLPEDFDVEKNKKQLEKEREEIYKPNSSPFQNPKAEKSDPLSNDEDTTATAA